MKASLQPPDSHHLQAAQGWIELGNPQEANKELDGIRPSLQTQHPEVLKVRWTIYVQTKQFQSALEVAKNLSALIPDEAGTWVMLANSLYYLGRMQEAYDCAADALTRFPQDATLHYDLACYACYLGKVEDASKLLHRSFELDSGKALRLHALEDPDLKPLWEGIGNLD